MELLLRYFLDSTHNHMSNIPENFDREAIIEAAGLVTANKLFELESQILELRDWLKVVRTAQTAGYKLQPDPSYIND